MVHYVSFALPHSPLSRSGTSKNNSLHITGYMYFFTYLDYHVLKLPSFHKDLLQQLVYPLHN